MQNHLMVMVSAALATMSAGVAAYKNNCAGSTYQPSMADCEAALNSIDPGATYIDGAQFSVGHCYMTYATNGAGPQPLSGQTIRNTAQSILDNCKDVHGSYGTNTRCDICHVTINYRKQTKD